MRTNIFLTATLALASVGLNAGAPDTQSAFDRLKSLAGEWQADTGKGKVHLTYEVIAGGTAVVERDSGENMPAMLTVYHMDGSRLLLEHYCMAGNQPRMEAQSFNGATGELRFEFLDATNLANKDAGHMHNATLRFVDGDHLSANWEFFEAGKMKMQETFQYSRVK